MPRLSPVRLSSRLTSAALLAGALLLGGCSGADDAPAAGGAVADAAGAPDTMGAAADSGAAGEWVALFDGTDLDQWHGYHMDHVPASWSIQDGVLALGKGGAEHADLVTRTPYRNFDLELDWKISEGGNSGILYRVGDQEDETYKTGPEMQVLDDERHPDGKLPSHRAGALYDLVEPPSNVALPVGQWNHARIRVQGDHIQQWLNGHLTADVQVGSEDWNRRLAASKFKSMANFAKVDSGSVALQDHGDVVWYRNIRIRPLPES
jgi:hypothetical protein